MRGSEYFDLRAFATIIEHGSFVRAARHLGMTPSSLSQLVRQLESRLDVRLLNRTTRSLSLTDAGTRLFERAKPALAELEAAMEEIRDLRRVPAGVLRIYLPRLLAKTFLEPLLGPFNQAFPHVVLDVTIGDALINIVEGGFDLGIRLAEDLEDDVVAVPVGAPLRHVAVATAEYLEKFGRPQRPADLHRHRCINWRQHGDGEISKWEFRRGNRSTTIAVEGPLVVSERNLALAAALQGVGIALLSEHLVSPLVEQGLLVPFLQEWCPPRSGWNLYYHKQRHTPATVRAFVDFVNSIRTKA
jgi:DNA-binding transcriptional LysR family regulator